jgi:hypothetical protein
VILERDRRHVAGGGLRINKQRHPSLAKNNNKPQILSERIKLMSVDTSLLCLSCKVFLLLLLRPRDPFREIEIEKKKEKRKRKKKKEREIRWMKRNEEKWSGAATGFLS